MAKTNFIELGDGEQIPILYEDRTVLAIDKPAGWMLVPVSWQKTDRNLHAAILSSIEARDFWASSRNLKFLRHVHRLDAETSGILLMVKSPGAVRPFSDLFEARTVEKRYLVVVDGSPKKDEWTCNLPLGPDPNQIGRQRVDSREGKTAVTHFRVLQRKEHTALLEAFPVTGRTHQIRLHAKESGCPVSGDPLYGTYRQAGDEEAAPMGLRSVYLSYKDPFSRRQVWIRAPEDAFMKTFGFTREPRPPQVVAPEAGANHKVAARVEKDSTRPPKPKSPPPRVKPTKRPASGGLR